MDTNPATTTTTSTTSSAPDVGPNDVVDRFLGGLGAEGAGLEGDVFAADAVLDATVPMWRLEVVGGDAVRTQLDEWFALGVTWEAVNRRPVTGGEAVELDFAWIEDGVPHAGHQVHLLEIEHGRIRRDTMFCGGRWPADLLAEMEAARAH